jgi:hypothetical protein
MKRHRVYPAGTIVRLRGPLWGVHRRHRYVKLLFPATRYDHVIIVENPTGYLREIGVAPGDFSVPRCPPPWVPIPFPFGEADMDQEDLDDHNSTLLEVARGDQQRPAVPA